MVHSSKIIKEGKTQYIITYDSLQDVYNQIEKCKDEISKIWDADWNKYIRGFHYFNNFGEAMNALRVGWVEGVEKIKDKLDNTLINSNKTKVVNEFNVVGFQASVPRYLQGIPTNMINQKKIPAKQKVMTIVKHIGFLSDVSEETIIENSVKALAIVKKIEDSGIRCNLDVISPVTPPCYYDINIVIRIRIKNASERMNLGKIAFALANPDMLRRIMFALRYTLHQSDLIDNQYFTYTSMGASIYDREHVKSFLKPGEKYLHNFIENIDNEVKEFNKII